jgi:Cytochrome bd terminal oxidase subunit II
VADVIELEDLNKKKRVPDAIATIPLCELPNSANRSSIPSVPKAIRAWQANGWCSCHKGRDIGYGLLGAGWLILKTEGDIQAAARRQGRICLIGVVTAIAIVSIWTPIMVPAVAARWFSWPNIALFAPVPVLSGVTAVGIWRSLGSKAEAAPFFGAIVLFILTYAGMAISLFPMIVPYQLTLWEAASSPRTQAFLLVGTLFLIPVILTYSSWSYWEGTARGDEHGAAVARSREARCGPRTSRSGLRRVHRGL